MKSKAIFTAATLFCLGFILAAFFAASGHAAASSHPPDGGGSSRTLKSWDTDNLKYSGYTAKTFGVPFHDYDGYLRSEPAKPCVYYDSQAGISTLFPSVYGGGCRAGTSPMTHWCVHIRLGNDGYEYAYAPPSRAAGLDRQRCPGVSPFYTIGAISPVPAGGVQLCGTLQNGIWTSTSVSADCGAGRRVRVSSRSHEACDSGVADAFFQTVSGGRNDFPVLEITDTDRQETSPALKSWGASRNRGCDEFATAQDRLVSTVAANGGYWLDDRGRSESFPGE